MNRIETEAKINVHAWKDSAFREKLLKNPQEALQEIGMKKIPEALNIKVVEEDKDQWVIRLNKRPYNFMDLSDDVLEKVALGEPQEASCCPKRST